MTFKVGQKIGRYTIGTLTDVPSQTDWGKAHPCQVVVLEKPGEGPLAVRLARGETDPKVLLEAVRAEEKRRRDIVGQEFEV